MYVPLIVREYWESDSLYLGIFRYPVIEEETLNPIHGVMAEVPIVNDPPTPTSVSGIKMLQNYNYEIVVFCSVL